MTESNQSGAEMAARLTAASAVLGDFRLAVAAAPLASPPNMTMWSLRLACVLGDVIEAASDGR